MGHFESRAINKHFTLELFSPVMVFKACENLEKNGMWTRKLTKEIPFCEKDLIFVIILFLMNSTLLLSWIYSIDKLCYLTPF